MVKMHNTGVCVWTNVCIGLALLFFTTVDADPTRAFNNPLNGRAVDLFIIVDENNTYMSVMQLGLVKTALQNMANELNPVGSSPQFGAFFYGATSSLSTVVPYPTITAVAFKAKLDLKQYSMMQANPSTLVTALNTVDSLCQSSCRPAIPRVTVVFSSVLDLTAQATIRQLERNRGMTVIVVGIGSYAGTPILNQLASHPVQHYAIPIGNLFELNVVAAHISSIISDVPRFLETNINAPLIITSMLSGIYYTVQLNTQEYTTTKDVLVMLTTNCPSCSVYGSLSEPNPISANTVANQDRHNFYAAGGFPNSQYYFHIPKGTGRIYLSVLGNGMASANILAYVINLPNMMQVSAADVDSSSLSETIG
ncbi:unnamed protein product [Adineta steineri]|uniref:VWFA domain-containing protein n=2 Tax=Adineta steineri TaxID=433720 RepID=A0A815JYS3_9BILA|nr:unnamed protein product [Adineta steineri]